MKVGNIFHRLEDGGEVPAHYKMKFVQEVDRLVMKGSFEKGQLAMLILEESNTRTLCLPESVLSLPVV